MAAEAASHADESPWRFDINALREMFDGDDEMVEQIAEIFFGERPDWIKSLSEGLAAQDAEAVSRAAHRIKGALLNMEARPAANKAGQLEQEAKLGNLSNGMSLFAQIERDLENIESELRAHVG